MHGAERVYVQTVLAPEVKTGHGGHTESPRLYSVIEALWKLSPVDDRKAFFEKAKTIYIGYEILDQ